MNNTVWTFIIFLLTLITPSISRSQSLYGSVSSETGHLSDFYGIQFNDSVLFSYLESTGSGEMRRAKWIKEGGHVTDVYLTTNPFAIAAHNENVYYYYVTEENKKVKLGAVIDNTLSHTRVEALSSVLLPNGILLASYLDTNLFLLVLDRDENRITSLEVHGLEIVEEKHYNVPAFVSKYIRKSSDVEFFNGDDSAINSFKGSSKMKLYRYDQLYIVIDSSSPYEKGTHVFVLRDGNEDVEQYSFPIQDPDHFVSFLIDDKLFRSVTYPKRFTLTAHDLVSQKLLIRKNIIRGEQEFDGYFRHSRSRAISRRPLADIMRAAAGNHPSLAIFKDSAKYVIQWGLVEDENGVLGPYAIMSWAGIIISTVGTAILQITEGPDVSQHFYLEGDRENLTFNVPETSSFVRKKVDDYEISMQTARKDIPRKNYIPYKKGIMAIYYDPKAKVADLVNFQ